MGDNAFPAILNHRLSQDITVVLQAYASYMKGTLLFEQDRNWDTALMNFKSARYIMLFLYPCYYVIVITACRTYNGCNALDT